MVQLEIVLYREGKSVPFTKWFESLKDTRTVAVVRARLNRIVLGNFGDSKSVGAGVSEMRIDFGPGYRLYFGRHGSKLVVLLCGGAKRTQARDIEVAQKYWRKYLDAKSGD